MTKPWWQNHPPAEMCVDCSGQQHQVRWQDGGLVLLDHNDPEGERTLAALGGDKCECVEILGSWERHLDDLRLLVLASRGAGDQIIHIDGPLLGSARAGPAILFGGQPQNRLMRAVTSSTRGWVSRAPQSLPSIVFGPAGIVDQDEVLSLLRLGGGLLERLVATVLAVWTERVSIGDERVTTERAALTAALHGRATTALRSWLNEPDLVITLEMIDPSDPAELIRGPEGILVRLPFSWLIDVWARGVSVVLGRFATKVLDSEDHRQRVLTVSPDLRDVRPVTISIG